MQHYIRESDVEALAIDGLRDLGWSICAGLEVGREADDRVEAGI